MAWARIRSATCWRVHAGVAQQPGGEHWRGWFEGQVPGTFGTYFGGILMAPYANYLLEATGGDITLVPEPESVALFGLALALLLFAHRRRIK